MKALAVSRYHQSYSTRPPRSASPILAGQCRQWEDQSCHAKPGLKALPPTARAEDRLPGTQLTDYTSIRAALTRRLSEPSETSLACTRALLFSTHSAAVERLYSSAPIRAGM